MSAKTIVHQAMLNEWATRIADQKASGLNVSELCIRNGLIKDKYFYWKRKIKNELITQVMILANLGQRSRNIRTVFMNYTDKNPVPERQADILNLLYHKIVVLSSV
jgi:hypothetical protein